MKLWLKLPLEWRVHIVSAYHTFVAAFIGSVLLQFAVPFMAWVNGQEVTFTFDFSKDALFAIAMIALRQASKEVVKKEVTTASTDNPDAGNKTIQQ